MDSSTPTAGQSKTNAQVTQDSSFNVLKEIEKLLKEVDDLVARVPRDDPRFKSNMKKLSEIKHFLEKKHQQFGSSNTSLFEKLKLKKKKSQVTIGGEEEIVSEPLQRPPQDLINVNLDDSVLEILDEILSVYHFVQNIVGLE